MTRLLFKIISFVNMPGLYIRAYAFSLAIQSDTCYYMCSKLL